MFWSEACTIDTPLVQRIVMGHMPRLLPFLFQKLELQEDDPDLAAIDDDWTVPDRHDAPPRSCQSISDSVETRSCQSISDRVETSTGAIVTTLLFACCRPQDAVPRKYAKMTGFYSGNGEEGEDDDDDDDDGDGGDDAVDQLTTRRKAGMSFTAFH